MNKTDYATLVCGGVGRAKQLLAEELRAKRKAKGLTPESLDAIFKFGPEWPSVSEIEKDPRLLTHEFLQKIGWMIIERPEDYERAVEVTGEEIERKIGDYLQNTPGALERALEEFKSETKSIRVEAFSPEILGQQVESVLQGEQIVTHGSANSIPPEVYARIHIFSSIMDQLNVVSI